MKAIQKTICISLLVLISFACSSLVPVSTATPSPTDTSVPAVTTKLALTKTPTEISTGISTETSTEAPIETSTEVPTEEPVETSTEEPTEVPIENSTEEPTEASIEISTEVPTEIISQTQTISPEMPSQFGLPQPYGEPAGEWEGLPIMPGALAGEGDSSGYSFTIEATSEEVEDFYDTELANLGWESLSVGEVPSGPILLIFTQDANVLSISIIPQADGTMYVLLVK